MTFSKRIKDKIEPYYQSDNLTEEFYKPVLKEAKSYKRVSAYFSSSGLGLYAQGLKELFNNDGYVKFIISTSISKKDFDKIQDGYKIRTQIKDLPFNLKSNILNTETEKNLGDLAFMIAQGRAEVKFAIVNSKSGIFHDKFGIISSDDENVFFTGSVNETKSGLEYNYESISVDVSWDKSEMVQERIKNYGKRFDKLWKNEEEGISVKDATDVVYDEIAKYQEKSSIKFSLSNSQKKDELPLKDFNGVYFRILSDNTIVRDDQSKEKITSNDRRLTYDRSDLSIYFQEDNNTVKKNTTYKDIEEIIDFTRKRCDRKGIEVIVSLGVKEYLAQSKYSIKQYQILGRVLKDKTRDFQDLKGKEFNEFSKSVQNEVSRPLRNLHLRVAYYEYKMSRVANFSVPGAGKTAMILGVFAYLNRKKMLNTNEYINKILVISPINAFESWKSEFIKVFGKKKKLRSIDCQTSNDFFEDLNIEWGTSNLVLVNYESLQKYSTVLKQLIDSKTMLVFDEVHRIKNPNGQRAKSSLEIVKNAKFKFVMTGTPIPNSYEDIYNFLHILYSNEYNSFFGWDPSELLEPNVREIEKINYKLEPFFWRVNKKDLGVPPADKDNLILVNPTAEQMELAKSIYYTEKSSLARLIRLIQASTNPNLLTKKISYSQMGFNNEDDTVDISQEQFNKEIHKKSNSIIQEAKSYDEFDLSSMKSSKFNEGIELVKKLVSEKKKVLVWAIFVDTMKKIQFTLNSMGIRTNLVYGDVNFEERQNLINEFKDGNVQVMVSNPQTLGESISLHESVHDAVYFEYNFNLTFMLQSRDRIHRLGLPQNQYTRYYYLETLSENEDSGLPGYIDQKIYDRLKEKEDVMNKAIDNDTLSIEYSDNEIAEAIKIIDSERSRIQKNRNE